MQAVCTATRTRNGLIVSSKLPSSNGIANDAIGTHCSLTTDSTIAPKVRLIRPSRT
jgi:hypothetical protein